MTGATSRHAATITGTNAAAKQVIRLGLDVDSPIDIFGVIEHEHVWLLFEKLENLYGFFQRENEVAGIALHSGHPLSLQRFTAAHEYGHFVLGHVLSQDGISEVFGGTDLPVQEIEAQAFAAEFLMPLALVNRALARLSLPESPHLISPAEVYQLALEMGASYRATVARLNQLNKISFDKAKELRGFEPKTLKVQLGRGHGPANPRAAVWSLDEALSHRHLNLRIEDELHVRLAEIPSSGFRWSLGDGTPAGLELVLDDLERPTDRGDRFGGAVTRHLWWRAVDPGEGRLSLRLTREWQGPHAQAAEELSVPLSIQIPRTGTESSVGIALPQRRAILASA